MYVANTKLKVFLKISTVIIVLSFLGKKYCIFLEILFSNLFMLS